MKTNAETGSESETWRALPARRRASPATGPRSAGGREVLDDEIEDQVGADVVETGGAQNGEQAHLAHGGPQSLLKALRRQRALVEELLQQGVVAFGHHLDQGFVGLLGGVGQVAGDVAFLALAAAARLVGVGLHADQVDDAAEIALGAEGQLDGDGGAAEILLDAGQRPLEAGALAVQLVDDDGARQA